jgi:hypothetical protein
MNKIKKAFAVILSLALLCGCGATTAGMTPEQILDSFIQDYRNCDFEGMYSLTNDGYAYFEGMYDEENANNRYLFGAMTNNLDFEVTNVEINDDTANIYANVKNINMYNVISDITKDTSGSASIVSDTVDAHRDDIVEKEVVFNFVKDGNNWVIESNLGIYSDLTGGYLQYIYEVSWLGMTGEEAKEKYSQNAGQ